MSIDRCSGSRAVVQVVVGIEKALGEIRRLSVDGAADAMMFNRLLESAALETEYLGILLKADDGKPRLLSIVFDNHAIAKRPRNRLIIVVERTERLL